MRGVITWRTAVCGTRVSPGATNTGCPPDGGAALGAAAAMGAAMGAAPGLADSTSALTMRPFGPLPVMRERSSPFSAAMRLASGEAKMRPPLGAAAGFPAGACAARAARAAGPAAAPPTLRRLGPVSRVARRGGGLDDVLRLGRRQGWEFGGIRRRHVAPVPAFSRGAQPVEGMLHHLGGKLRADAGERPAFLDRDQPVGLLHRV